MCRRKIRGKLFSSTDGRDMCLVESGPDCIPGPHEMRLFGSTKVINMNGEFVEVVVDPTEVPQKAEAAPQVNASPSIPIPSKHEPELPQADETREMEHTLVPLLGTEVNQKGREVTRIISPISKSIESHTAAQSVLSEVMDNPSQKKVRTSPRPSKQLLEVLRKVDPSPIYSLSPPNPSSTSQPRGRPTYEMVFAGIAVIITPLCVIPILLATAFVILAFSIVGILGCRLVMSLFSPKYFKFRDLVACGTIGLSLLIFVLGGLGFLGYLALIPLPSYLILIIYEAYQELRQKRQA